MSRLQWVSGRYVVAYSENDTQVQIYDVDNELVTRYAGDVPFKSGALDPQGEFFAATACDGQVHIFRVPGLDSG